MTGVWDWIRKRPFTTLLLLPIGGLILFSIGFLIWDIISSFGALGALGVLLVLYVAYRAWKEP